MQGQALKESIHKTRKHKLIYPNPSVLQTSKTNEKRIPISGAKPVPSIPRIDYGILSQRMEIVKTNTTINANESRNLIQWDTQNIRQEVNS